MKVLKSRTDGELESKEALKIEYNSNDILYKSLEQEVKYILEVKLLEQGIKIHSILSRIKEFDSFYEKIDRKNLSNPFAEIKDIVGIRVICLFKSDIEKIGGIIKEFLDVVEEDNKIDDFEQVSSFGYMSFHYIAKLKDEYTGPRYDSIKTINFEIQVRTISMDAWANISHYLDYKSEEDIPKELKKDFHALSGLFYVADSHFEFFMKSILEAQREKELEVKNMLENERVDSSSHEKIVEDLTFDSLKSYLEQKFADREVSDPKVISDLFKELSTAGYKTLNELDDVINRTKNAFELYEKLYPPGNADKFAPVGVVRSSLNLVDEEFRKVRNVDSRSVGDRYKDPEILRLIQH